MTILVTGAGGYIGSHMVLKLIEEGESVCTLDNFVTGFEWAIHQDAKQFRGDVGDYETVSSLIEQEAVDSVFHFAGSVVGPDSITDPLKFYHNNTANTATLVGACVDMGVDKFIFSSTAAVYADIGDELVNESHPLSPASPYGRSKLMSELMLADVSAAHPFRHTILRYFNVAGSDPQARVGQSTLGSTHLVKAAAEVALGKRDQIKMFGDDYDTADGTCVRDFIHVTDLTNAHYLALQRLRTGADSLIANLGYGHGVSVREILDTVRERSGVDFKIETGDRRTGDLASVVADSKLARETLNWEPELDDLAVIVDHTLNWEKKLSQINSHKSASLDQP